MKGTFSELENQFHDKVERHESITDVPRIKSITPSLHCFQESNLLFFVSVPNEIRRTNRRLVASNKSNWCEETNEISTIGIIFFSESREVGIYEIIIL